MGRIAVFTEKKIINAGLEIEAEGDPVTPFAIKNRLGGGDSRRIKAIWNEHLEGRDLESKTVDEKDEIELPQELKDALEHQVESLVAQLNRFASSSYQIAQEISEKRETLIIDEYKQKIVAFEKNEAQALEAIELAEDEIDALQQELTTTQEKIELLSLENAKLAGQSEQLSLRVKQLEALEKEHGLLQREYGKLEGQIQAMSKDERK